MNIEYIKTENIKPAPWKATYIFRPELKLLEESIASYGILTPLIIRSEDSTIIDGFARWVVAQRNPSIRDNIPATFVSANDSDAMILHVRLNRARGFVVAKDLSNIVAQLFELADYTPIQIQQAFNMTTDEFEAIADGTLIKKRKIKEHKYSNAWVPVETNGPTEKISIERPPNPDR